MRFKWYRKEYAGESPCTRENVEKNFSRFVEARDEYTVLHISNIYRKE